MTVVVVPTGTANLASVCAALRAVAAEPIVDGSTRAVESAERVVLPGVGAFGAAMARLEALGCVDALRRRIETGRPTLAICLGLQLLAESSAESPGIAGLGAIPGSAAPIDDLRSPTSRVPHMGRVALDLGPLGADLAAPIDAYFAHGYGLREVPAEWRAVRVGEPGRSAIAAIRRHGVLACQFHPELSGEGGLELIRSWLECESDPAPTSAASGLAPWAATRLIPCLDLREGRVVKGVRFGDLIELGDPVELAARYADGGADEIVLLDIDATNENRAAASRTIEAIRTQVAVPLTVGGGVRTLGDVEALLGAGADKVAINSAAIERPGLIETMAERFGRQCTVVAVDATRCTASDGWTVRTRAGSRATGLDAIAWCREAVRRGAGELLVTSIDRDGTRTGYDLDLMRTIAAVVRVPLIASGGAGTIDHLVEARAAGVDGLLVAGMLHRGEVTVAQLRCAVRSGVGSRRLGFAASG